MAAPEIFARSLYSETLAAPRKERQAISRELFRSVMSFSELSADFLTCATGIFATYFLYLSLHIGTQIQYSLRELAAVSIVFGLFVVLLLQRDGAYRGGGSLLQIRETERAIRIPTQSLLLLLPFSFLLNLNFSRVPFLVALVLIPLLLILQKQIFSSIIRILQVQRYGIDRVVVYGAGDTGKRIVSALLYSTRLGLQPVSVIDDDPALAGDCMFEMGYRRSRSVPVQRGPVTPALLKACQCNMLMVAIPNLSTEQLAAAAHAAKQAGLRIAFLLGSPLQEPQWTESTDIDGLLLTSTFEPVAPWHYAIAKRMADLIVSSLLLVLFSPLLFLIAFLIRLDSSGPALFVQKRVGRNGELFDMYKFRSMHTNTPRYDVSPTQSCDPRITRIGRFLRRISLDELPQLMNVFLGNMSLVGPRPEMPFIAQHYNCRQRQRLQVTPGITGLWQLSADRALPIHENVEYDLYYIRNRTFFMDIAILIHTLFFAMHGGV
ncbi:MAG: exopolysaccharide biosynthesis polyprenyl glycosylphosphotransferase [Acidobacteriaceae bacterium]